jgi:hypothetical protein
MTIVKTNTDSELIERLREFGEHLSPVSGDYGSEIADLFAAADRLEALSLALAEAEKQRDEAIARADKATSANERLQAGNSKMAEGWVALINRADALEAKLRVAVEAQAKLSAFVRYVLAEGPWAGHGIDGGDTQDAAERFGLISPAPYDPAKHGYHVDFSDGDRWFKFTPLVLPLSSIGATTPGGEAMSTDNVLTERLLAAARIEALSLALAEAEKQRDEADEECRLSMTTIAEGRDRADALEAKLRVAVEALRPFANYPVGSIGMGEDGYVMTLAVGGQEPTFADFERARAALSSIGEV